jgi:glycosyltransferase involved in cell wall biosynthesis
VIFVPFPSQTAALIARALGGRPVVADFFTSHYEGYVSDRAKVSEHSFRARWYRMQDLLLARVAHWYLVDTQEHANYYAREFDLDLGRVTVVPVGTDIEVMQMATELSDATDRHFLVHWHGTYIPLQGAEVIVRAAGLLASSEVAFRMIGAGQTHQEILELARKLEVTNIEFRDKVPYQDLPGLMAESDVCLGIFGVTEKAQRVVPNKVYEAFAVGKPLVTADTPAIHEVFDSSCAMLVPAGDERALAGSIAMLMRNAEMRWQLARTGHARFVERAGPEAIASIMKHIFTMLV